MVSAILSRSYLETGRRLAVWGDHLARQVLQSSQDNSSGDAEADSIERRALALALAALHPALEAQLRQFAPAQRDEYAFLAAKMGGAVWAIQKRLPPA